ncbi:P-loop containing nucleoside triphosphate hydrolases superfamily protein [Raphanus sativus]|nr:P-loop containing nucleoside triphosphate hydrolases superfamily protein [Raphanus sativus]
MILGNVIISSKLSAHILNRDSKLIGILQPALGDSQFSKIMGCQKAGNNVEHPLSDQWETLRVSLKNTTSSLVSYIQTPCEILNSQDKGQETTALEAEKLKSELRIEERYNDLLKESSLDKQLLEASKESHERLEKEVQFLKEERDSLDVTVSQSSQSTHGMRVITSDKENALKDLHVELKRREYMEKEIKQISFAFF